MVKQLKIVFSLTAQGNKWWHKLAALSSCLGPSRKQRCGRKLCLQLPTCSRVDGVCSCAYPQQAAWSQKIPPPAGSVLEGSCLILSCGSKLSGAVLRQEPEMFTCERWPSVHGAGAGACQVLVLSAGATTNLKIKISNVKLSTCRANNI